MQPETLAALVREPECARARTRLTYMCVRVTVFPLITTHDRLAHRDKRSFYLYPLLLNYYSIIMSFLLPISYGIFIVLFYYYYHTLFSIIIIINIIIVFHCYTR